MMPSSALFTDLYQLTMLQAHFRTGRHRRFACFDLFFRRQPFGGGYSLAAGLDDAVAYLETLRFSDDDLTYLDSRRLFTPEFLAHLQDFRFTGEVYAAPEGTVVFPLAPILRVQGAIEECQLVESALLNIFNLQSLIATKAARVCQEAGVDNVLEFGLRRAPGRDGALSATRAAYLGGCFATSNVEAARRFGITVAGTQAHSWIMAADSELESFRDFVATYPRHAVLLVDTYDTLAEGVPHALVIGREMQQRGETLRGVRLDSGDLSALAKTTRRMLDEAGLTETSIVASGDLDEYRIRDLRRQGAPIDMFGVGTRLVTGHGDEAFTGVYKLAAIADETGAWRAVHKKTDDPQKASLPGIKQVWRLSNHAGEPIGDWMESADGAPDLTAGLVAYDLTTGRETRLGAEVATVRPLLELVFQSGRRVADSPPLVQLRAQARQNVAALPVAFRRLDEPARYPLYFGPRLRELANP